MERSEKFYILGRDITIPAKFAQSEHSSDNFKVGDADRCPVCNGAVSMLKLRAPIEIKFSNSFLGDFVYGEISPFIVSEDVLNAFAKTRLIGIEEFIPVVIANGKLKGKQVHTGYYLPQIARSEARIDEVGSQMVRSGKPICFECRRGTIIDSFERLVLQPNTWSGEDIFYAKWLSGEVFISQAFVEFLKANKFTNAIYTDSRQYRSQF
jgi:hypothetical protein